MINHSFLHGQYKPESGGHNTPESHGQLSPVLGGQYHRFFHLYPTDSFIQKRWAIEKEI